MDKDKEIKKAILNWRKNHQDLRFGQWLWNKFAEKGLWQAPQANALFYIEDEDLVKLLFDEVIHF